MDVYEGSRPIFPGLTDEVGTYRPLPPNLFDFEANSPDQRVEQALTWLAEAQQLIATLQDRIAYLENLTTTDELTGLLNRRGFFEHFARALGHARRDAGCSGLLIMIDLNGFKIINDTLGHAAGDAVLCHVGRSLCAVVRAQDVVARLGGDEFAVLLTTIGPSAGTERATVLARTLNREQANWRGHAIPISLSIGTATYGPHDRETAVMRNADAAMYADKGTRARSCRRSLG